MQVEVLMKESGEPTSIIIPSENITDAIIWCRFWIPDVHAILFHDLGYRWDEINGLKNINLIKIGVPHHIVETPHGFYPVFEKAPDIKGVYKN